MMGRMVMVSATLGLQKTALANGFGDAFRRGARRKEPEIFAVGIYQIHERAMVDGVVGAGLHPGIIDLVRCAACLSGRSARMGHRSARGPTSPCPSARRRNARTRFARTTEAWLRSASAPQEQWI